jgi:hypothetical protein
MTLVNRATTPRPTMAEDPSRYPDPQHDLMLSLMADGMDQWSASLLAYGDNGSPVHSPLRIDWSIWVNHLVRRLGNELRLKLGLPIEDVRR